jgi:hypothetical protein
LLNVKIPGVPVPVPKKTTGQTTAGGEIACGSASVVDELQGSHEEPKFVDSPLEGVDSNLPAHVYKSRPQPIVNWRRGARRRPRPLIGVLRHGSLGDFDSIIVLDTKITDRTLDFRSDQTQST